MKAFLYILPVFKMKDTEMFTVISFSFYLVLNKSNRSYVFMTCYNAFVSDKTSDRDRAECQLNLAL